MADRPHLSDASAQARKASYRQETEFAPERFERFDAPRYQFEITRRELWQSLGAGILLTITLPLSAQEPDAARVTRSPRQELSTRFLFSQTDPIRVLTGKVEIGQGARTLLAQAAAEELRLPVSALQLVMGDTDICPDDGGTWASLTTPQTVPAMRQAAAFARELFLELATAKFGQSADALQFTHTGITSGTRQLTYFELAELAESAKHPADAALTPPAEWKTLGQSVPPIEGRAIVTGAKRYASDLKLPGMLHGLMVRGSHYNGKLATLRGEPKLPQNTRMVRDGDFLGVVAPSPELAHEAANSIRAIWRANALLPETRLHEEFMETAREPVAQPGARYPGLITRGDPLNAYWSSQRRLESKYSLAYIAHVPLETRAAIAEWKEGKVTIHYGCQAPFLVRQEVAEAMGIPETSVRILAHDSGSAFGGKQRGEIAVEVARLARDTGKPVKLTWNREEEFTASYVRPAGLLEVRSGADAEGRLRAWEFHNYNSGASGIACHYDIPHAWCGYHPARSPLRQGSYRSLAAVANTFAREMHMEEWAAILKQDPIAFRLRHIADERLREVLERGTAAFGWGRSVRMAGVAQGVACNLEKDARFALFMEIQVSGADVRLRRALMVFDAGAALNPDNLKNQIQGAVVQGIGGALFEKVDYADTRIRNARLSRYRVPRFEDVPDVEVLLIDRREVPAAGAGEAPITVVAPAIAAAIHRGTGHWVRELPLLPALARIVNPGPAAEPARR
ncbi:MAG: molybdopterin-dependent oxidoreductase [Bryobacterales bacterium]|nr:molybdopterin-dependent oxidoreductase [Bryobacterales bacterium]